jgi:hypothetical protein
MLSSSLQGLASHNYVTPLHSSLHVGKKRAFRGSREASFIYVYTRVRVIF